MAFGFFGFATRFCSGPVGFREVRVEFCVDIVFYFGGSVLGMWIFASFLSFRFVESQEDDGYRGGVRFKFLGVAKDRVGVEVESGAVIAFVGCGW